MTWKRESERHALASKGIRTSFDRDKQYDYNLDIVKMAKTTKETENEELNEKDIKDNIVKICEFFDSLSIPNYVDKIYLFGSRAKGIANDESDYDFYVKLNEEDIIKRISKYVDEAKELLIDEWDDYPDWRKHELISGWHEVVEEELEDEIYEIMWDELHNELKGDIDLMIGIDDFEDFFDLEAVTSTTRTRFEEHKGLEVWSNE